MKRKKERKKLKLNKLNISHLISPAKIVGGITVSGGSDRTEKYTICIGRC